MPETTTEPVTRIRRAIAESEGITFNILEPHDYQEQTAAVLHAVADLCDEAGAAYASRGLSDQAGAAFALMETFLKAAGQAEYVATPCDFVACDPDGGEPCATHERLMSHAEDNHELCDHAAPASPAA